MQGLDVEKYRPYVDDFDLSYEEKDKLLKLYGHCSRLS